MISAPHCCAHAPRRATKSLRAGVPLRQWGWWSGDRRSKDKQQSRKLSRARKCLKQTLYRGKKKAAWNGSITADALTQNVEWGTVELQRLDDALKTAEGLSLKVVGDDLEVEVRGEQ